MTYKLHKLNQNGTNAQGVPLGLVNWMCLNRLHTMPKRDKLRDKHFTVPTEAPKVLSIPQRRLREREPAMFYKMYHYYMLWADLALAKRGEFKNEGLITFNTREWRRHQ
ncbi:hypothetical protein LCGC14_0481830 [marine sediment metagenome]|uniref:Uncharacterized protein n=1 Tax=marine sediment metagenome TaxID=412755 RepID=A0A0F9VI11_9ZZZZ